ncbi:hypothetical protein FACS1894110_23080 [Spirochaetia bacterium]|nr:hypothetical protein FACS1894110_23080 [Spirochaetia bacterium]
MDYRLIGEVADSISKNDEWINALRVKHHENILDMQAEVYLVAAMMLYGEKIVLQDLQEAAK